MNKHDKNMALKGRGSKEKKVGLKGGATKKNPSNFAVTAFVIIQTPYQDAKTQRF